MHSAYDGGKESTILIKYIHVSQNELLTACLLIGRPTPTVFSARGGCILEEKFQILNAAMHIDS